MKKKWAVSGIAGIIVICVIVFLVFKFSGQETASETVYVDTVESITGMGNGLQNRYMGIVESQENWKVSKSESKTIEEIFVKVGDEVHIGDPLVRYDTVSIENDLNQTQLDIERIGVEIANLNAQIQALEKEKKEAPDDQKLEYTIQIQTAQTDIKKNEYDRKSKEASLTKLQNSLNNAVVTSEIDGVVQSVQSQNSQSSVGTDSDALITVLKTGEFRIKGTINEQNIGAISKDARVIIRSRIDDNKTWMGTITKIDTESPQSSASNNMYGMDTSDASSKSSKYPFYVRIDSSSDGLMMGQHVYIELDQGQTEEKTGLWLGEYFIVDVDSNPYVWADNGSGSLEKRTVKLGEYDENNFSYEILEGLTDTDAITFPEEDLTEGMKTQQSQTGQLGKTGSGNSVDETMDETMDESVDMTGGVG